MRSSATPRPAPPLGCGQIFWSVSYFDGSRTVRVRPHSGCWKRFQATRVGGKLFVKSFPPHPPSETSRLLLPCRLLPVGQTRVFGRGSGGKPFFRHRTSSAWHGHSEAEGFRLETSWFLQPCRLLPARRPGSLWNLGENLSSERFPPAQATSRGLEPRSLITPLNRKDEKRLDTEGHMPYYRLMNKQRQAMLVRR